MVDGVCQLSTAEDLKAFAEYVNLGASELNAVLTNDVDYSEYNVMIGANETTPYYGTFDGQGHTVNVDIDSKDGMAALFRHFYGKVMNLCVTGDINTGNTFAGGIVAKSYVSAVVENCISLVNIYTSVVGDGTHGGIVGHNVSGVTVNNCIFAGKMIGDQTNNCGGIVGWSSSTSRLNNCIYAGDMTGLDQAGDNWTFSRNSANVIMKDCFYLNAFGEVNEGGKQFVGGEEIWANGSACFQANGDQTSLIWYQNIGQDNYPIPFSSHKTVYASGNLSCNGKVLGEAQFNNEGPNAFPAHSNVDGFCSVCGTPEEGYVPKDAEGWYLISTPNDMIYFSNLVSRGYNNVKGKLTADLDFSENTLNPIGNLVTPFSGQFDGQFHRIHNLKINLPTEQGVGVFGALTGNVIIKNLVLSSDCSILGDAFVGLVGGTIGEGSLTMSHLGNEGSVTAVNQNAASIYGCNYGGTAIVTMEYCYAAGPVTGGRESAALSGWMGNYSSIDNCWVTSEVQGADGEDAMVARFPSDGICISNDVYVTIGKTTAKFNKLSSDAGVSGELCYQMNNGKMVDPLWHQNIGEDEHPVFDKDHGVVYQVDETTYADVHDDASFEAFRTTFIANQRAYLEEVIATQALIDQEKTMLNNLESIATFEEFLKASDAVVDVDDKVKESEEAYAAYLAEAEFIQNELEAHPDMICDERELLEGYLEGEVGPTEYYPHGSLAYVIANHVLTTEEINAEKTGVRAIYDLVLIKGYSVGADITNLLKNADFKDSFNGWEGTVATGVAASNLSDNPYMGAECWAKTFDMHQTLTGLKNGVYELRVNGAYRANNDDLTLANYAPGIYANNNRVYLPTVLETAISVEDAVDVLNCNINGPTPDFPVLNENGDTIAWAMHGQVSIANAAFRDRALNHILTNVTDGTLTVGIANPGTGGTTDWTGFAHVRLIYLGELENANLDGTLNDQIARATTLINNQPHVDETYALSPNFPQSLKDEMAATIAKAQGTEDNAVKYECIEKFSQLFTDVYTSKRAYISMLQQAEGINDILDVVRDQVDPNDYNEIMEAMNWATQAYVTGSASAEEALAMDRLKATNACPKEDEDGTYELNNVIQVGYFILQVASGDTKRNANLNCDIVNFGDGMMIPSYAGHFNGNYHTLTYSMSRSADNAAFFNTLNDGALVENLIVNGYITTSNKYAAGIASHTNGSVTIRGCQSYVDIVSSVSGDGTHAGLVGVVDGGSLTLENSLFAGSIQGEQTNSCGGLIGWNSGASNVNNCLQIANMDIQSSGCDTFGRNNANMTLNNCYYLTLVGTNKDNAIKTNEEQMKSGELCYLLNGSSDQNVAWYQNLGTDEYPVPAPTRQIVSVDENGSFVNIPVGIQSIQTNVATDGAVYNMLGQKVKKAVKGIYIVNGQKVLVK